MADVLDIDDQEQFEVDEASDGKLISDERKLWS